MGAPPAGCWSVSDCDPNDLIAVFKALRLKGSFAVHTYDFRSGGNGNGIIWAVPADAPLLAVEDCPGLDDAFLGLPKPPEAIPLMEAIEGDGSPWSYLSTSILGREAAEFGARRHGCVWSAQKIVAKPPRQAERTRDSKGDTPMGGWIWHGPAPRTWTPAYSESGTTKRVVLHIRDPVGRETTYRTTDTYRGDSYVSETSTTQVCTGPGGFVY